MFPHLDAPISPAHRDALSLARLHQVRAYLTLHPSVVPFPCLFLLASFPSNRYTLCGLSLHGTSPRCIPRGPPLDIVTPRCIRVSLAISSLSLSLSLSLSSPTFFFSLSQAVFVSLVPSDRSSFFLRPAGRCSLSFLPSLLSFPRRISLSLARGLPPLLRPDVFSSLCPCILPRRESAASSTGHTPVAP